MDEKTKLIIPSCAEQISAAKARELSSLALAFVGDAVYSLIVRVSVVEATGARVKELHNIASSAVKASSQAHLASEILPQLTEEESDVFLRARNTHVNTIAKNATVADYKYATACEALIGYLYLTGRSARLEELLQGKVF
ncbi:MAG: ribonuclease III domain-containing protein [Clostridia bacterium]